MNEFKKAHANSDVDFERQSQHHTLGDGPTQAAAGNHDHRETPIVIKSPNGTLYRLAVSNTGILTTFAL